MSDLEHTRRGKLPWWSVGYLIPRLIALALLGDVVLRLVPAGWIGAEYALLAHRLSGEAYVRSTYVQWSDGGDLSRLANLPDRRLYRSRSVSSDSLGYLNPVPIEKADGIVVGDSFGNVGATTADFLAGQLSRTMGCRFYNASGERSEIQAPPASHILSLAQHLGMRGGLVIVERLERLGPPAIPRSDVASAEIGKAPSFADRARLWMTVSPARVVAETMYKRAVEGGLLPNSTRHVAIEMTLSNGAWMLFYRPEMENYEKPRLVSIEYWTWLRAELAAASLELLVVLVPNKYTVYYPHLAEAVHIPVTPETYLAATEAALRRTGIPVINLTAALQREATDALRRGEYIYYRDDTHWNDAGISVAAQEISREWARSKGRHCR